MPGQTTELLSLIRSYEGSTLYAERNVLARAQGGAAVEALAFVGRYADKGHPIPLDRPWSSAADHLFRDGLNGIARIASYHLENVRPMPGDMDGFWAAFLPLQGLYLTLSTVLERYTALAFGHTTWIQGNGSRHSELTLPPAAPPKVPGHRRLPSLPAVSLSGR